MRVTWVLFVSGLQVPQKVRLDPLHPTPVTPSKPKVRLEPVLLFRVQEVGVLFLGQRPSLGGSTSFQWSGWNVVGYGRRLSDCRDHAEVGEGQTRSDMHLIHVLLK